MASTRRHVLRVAIGAASVLAMSGPAGAQDKPVTVFAASSLTEAMTQVARLWAAQGHAMPRLSFASSAVLAHQINEGAEADLFVSADETWMDVLARHGRIAVGTRVDLLGNTLVLVGPAGTRPVAIGRGLDLAGLMGANGRLAIGDPASVPAGIYARQALTTLGLWPQVAGRLAPAENVRAALLLVERGEAPFGIVYGSDMAVAPGLVVAGTFPADSHPPIRYPAALIGDRAAGLLAFLHTEPAMALFRAKGFQTL